MPMVSKKVRSALPVYIAAGAWLLCALLFPMYKLVWIIVAALVAVKSSVNADDEKRMRLWDGSQNDPD